MVELQAPTVRFPPGFLRRVELFAPRLAAARERREGAGGARLEGAGLEFVGRRPYRPGDDPRRIDWEVYAREDRPWVRVLQREAAEHWAVVVDASGSMGVGPPGKLQAAAEVAVAVAAVAVRARAVATVHLTEAAGGGPPRSALIRRPGDLARAVGLLAGAVARPGARGLGAFAREGRVPREAGRVVLLGDLWDTTPADVALVQRPGREVVVGRVSAPGELEPRRLGVATARFRDPEGDGAAVVALVPEAVAAYQRALEEELERSAAALARRRVRVHAWRSDAPFEEPAAALVDPR